MHQPPEFLREHQTAANALWCSGGVREPVFSRGTYNIEVQEKGKKKAFAFLQISDEGNVKDFFCTCKESEGGNGCIHLAASYLRIFNHTDEPLHIRFRKSFWNRIFQMEAKRQGTDPDCLVKHEDGTFQAKNFYIKTLTPQAEKRLEEILSKKVETEETSLKFSNLSSEELEQYRKGQASYQLRYELSFWSDLAQWLMELQDEKKPYTIHFSGEPLPSAIEVKFPEVELKISVTEVHLPWIIPSLSTIESPLKVIDGEKETLENVIYDEGERRLIISAPKETEVYEGRKVGEWVFVEGLGFYRKNSSPLFQEKVILEERIGETLNSYHKELGKFLPIHPEPKPAKYCLHFDTALNLHVVLDMPASAIFYPWIYVSQEGFYRITDWLFPALEKVVPKKEVADFINKNRLWLHQFPGFQTHIGSLDSYLTYTMDEALCFDVELAFPIEDMHRFDEWIYIRGQGFYMKKDSGRFPLHPGLCVQKEEISSFIDKHHEELEQVQGFFTSVIPIVQMGLSIGLNEEGLITTTPKIQYASNVDPSKIQFFGEYFYMEGKGFSAIPLTLNVPEKYRLVQVISREMEAAFLGYELDPLKPYILEIDPRLKKPSSIRLKIRKVMRDSRKRTQSWLVDLAYESELGVTDIFSIWDALFEKKKYIFSKAGFLYLKDARYNWIRQLPKQRLDRKKGLVRLNTLEWIRLNAFEEIKSPSGNDESVVETRKVLEELGRFETDRILDLSGLKSTLRPYQEQGVNWLWFLYCHGLSGLLCDDMGLGKTHQAMALLAGIINADPEKRNKYLVVCPTSVIYHWQELLKRFLPEIRVCTYYGISRSLDSFETNYDLMLTSYGILRQASDLLSEYSFEAAFYDEIQVAKNEASQTHQALTRMNAKMKLGLTGTPIENRIREIKSLFDVILPSYMPNDAVFRETFIKPIEKENDAEKKDLLGRLVKPFILRRKKSEVLRDLPEKIEEIAYSDLSEEQQKLYSEVAEAMRETIYQDLKDETKPVPYLHVFSALSKMKQICDHPALLSGDLKNYQKHSSGKWDLFVELLTEARESGQKVVIFSQYLDMLNIIESYLKKKGIIYASIKGSTRDRNEQLRKFREDPQCEVFVASLLAAGVGIDLTVASIVIHYDRWWNPAKENQATDRVHRIGQNRGVQVFKLVTKNTIEEDIHEIIERKKGLLEQIVGAEDQITYLSRDELLKVFEKMFRSPS
jgi:SNF2 family DNA or RNA helicase